MYKFENYCKAFRAMQIARFITGNYWYCTNERGFWEVREGL
jgi:hypothetical protein